jgi:hypothetical protein
VSNAQCKISSQTSLRDADTVRDDRLGLEAENADVRSADL